jgi:hypothetical protein
MTPSEPLFVGLAKVLIAFTDAFDDAMSRELHAGARRAPSLALFANVLARIGDDGIPMNALPERCGLAKPAVKSMVDCLARHGWVVVAPDGVVRATPRGADARRAFPRVVERVERAFERAWGRDVVATLRTALAAASARLDGTFPRYPMPASHRGGYPRGE